MGRRRRRAPIVTDAQLTGLTLNEITNTLERWAHGIDRVPGLPNSELGRSD